MHSTLFLSILCVAAAGCHDHGIPGDDMATMGDMSAGGEDMAIGDMGPPDDARTFVTYTMFAKDYAQTLCQKYMDCGQLDASQLNACLERFLRHTGWDQDVEIMKGRMQINELQCLDAIRNSQCDGSDVQNWTSRCVQFLYTPHQAKGSTCLSAEECTTGYCQHGGSDAGMPEQPNGCPGVCADPKPPGAICRVSTDCELGYFCDRSNTHTCLKLAMLNEACTNFNGLGSGPPCAFGLQCPTFPSGAPTCVVPSTQTTLHGACDPVQGFNTPTAACAPGMYCQLQYTMSATACTGAAGDCPDGYCDTGAMKCMDASGGKCEAKIASGTDCDPHNDLAYTFAETQCADGATCAQLSGQTKPTCQAFGGSGANCNDNGQCKVGLMCVSGKCAPWFPDGQQCGGTSPNFNYYLCTSQLCLPDNADAGAVGTCQQDKSFGASCIPGFEDTLCEITDLPGSTGCTPTTGGMGVCAPKCL